MIRAIFRDGQIRPVEPLPAEWADGEELTVQHASPVEAPDYSTKAEQDAAYEAWERGSAEITRADQDELQAILEELEAESKQAVRREWGLE